MKHKTSHNKGNAPDFDLPDQKENIICLDDFRGRWLVLYFYPKNKIPECLTEFTKNLKKFEKLNSCVIGVSSDSCENYCDFIKKNKIKITLLCDLNNKVTKKYNSLKKRSTFIINPQGDIKHSWKNIKIKDHAEIVLKKIQKLQNQT